MSEYTPEKVAEVIDLLQQGDGNGCRASNATMTYAAEILTAVSAERDAAIREMHAREMHHFEEEQISADLRADRDRLRKTITEALDALDPTTGDGGAADEARRILRAALDKEGNGDE